MIRQYIAAAFLIVATAFAAPAVAQDASARFFQHPIPDDSADQLLAVVTQNITSAHDDNGQPLRALTPGELQHPLLDRDLVKEVMDLGVASGTAQACGVDWSHGNFLPLMRRERARGDRTPHQIAAVAMVHGIVQGQISRAGTCGPTGAAATAAFFQRKWGVTVGPPVAAPAAPPTN